jgi:hypothetical protein
VHPRFDRVVAQPADQLPAVADHLDEARADILAFTAFPKAVRRQIWSNNPNERLNREIRRRTDVVGELPNRQSAVRLKGAVLAEQHDEWAEMRRSIGLEVLANPARPSSPTPTTTHPTRRPQHPRSDPNIQPTAGHEHGAPTPPLWT